MTRVAVVLPTKDRPPELARAVRSVLSQTHTDWELHIVDDGSAAPASLATDDPRVHLHRHDTARGVSAARNTALSAAGGDWVALLDDDDLWAPEKLAHQLGAAATHDAEMVWTATLLIDPVGRVLRANPVMRPDGPETLRRFNVVGEPSSVLVSRAAVDAAGGFAEDLSILADWDLWLRIAPHVGTWALDEPLTAIVEHPGSMQIVGLTEIERELAVLAERHGVHPDSPEMELYLTGKRWAAHRGVRTTAAYLRASARTHGTRGALRRLAGRGRARTRLAPAWVSELMRC
ncbi:glycosyltransferase [Svornostia abyssi]|uniref:Glycosyltransferase n=1 Tax=Svornostia abyssi TaxID=2898438 RepID=A0ABY5PDZ7_9ACTN|nr:glycosyltransferase [Parviterribacteraceae bacterium J379]